MVRLAFWRKPDDFKIVAKPNEIRITGNSQSLRAVANRILPNEIARQYDTPAPLSYTQPLPADQIPPGSGLAYKFSPYSQFYTKLYGVIPNADMTKYRQLLRNLPDVAARIEKRVTRAIGKKFTIKCEDPVGSEAAAFLEQWCKDVKLNDRLISSGTDALAYGNGYLELAWGDMQTTQITIQPTVTDPLTQKAVRGKETKAIVRGPMRAWVEETTICPRCHENTLYGIRYLDDYTFYGDVKAFASYVCRNPECSPDGGKTINPYRSALTNDQMQEQLAEVTSQFFRAQQELQPGIPPTPPTIDYKKRVTPIPSETTGDESKKPNTIVNVKDLDPIYMRPRADAFGNIFGYYQWISYPPVLLDPSMIIHFRWNPRSWGYETIFGTSILMPLIKYADMRSQWENDMATWVHTYGKPMLDVSAGTAEQPYSGPEMDILIQAYRQRTAGSDAVHKGNITIKPMQAAIGGGSNAAITAWVDYLLGQFHESLGVPEELMASEAHGATGRSTATVKMEDFIVTTEIFQAMLAAPFEDQVFPALLEANGYTSMVTTKAKKQGKEITKQVRICDLKYMIIWKPVFEEDPNTRSQRINDFRKAGVISQNEARSQIPDTEPILEGDKRYKPEYDDISTPIPAPGTLRAEGEPTLGADVGTPPTKPEQPTTGPNKLAPDNLTTPHGLDRGPFHAGSNAERIEAARRAHPDFFRVSSENPQGTEQRTSRRPGKLREQSTD